MQGNNMAMQNQFNNQVGAAIGLGAQQQQYCARSEPLTEAALVKRAMQLVNDLSYEPDTALRVAEYAVKFAKLRAELSGSDAAKS